MNLESTNLGNWTSDRFVSDTKQISDYTESTFAHLSGDSNISGNISIGRDNTLYATNSIATGKDNVIYTNNCAAIGENNVAGTRSYRIISGDFITKTWHLHTVEGLSVGLWYTVRLINNYDIVGTIEAIDEEDNKIIVSDFPQSIKTVENLSDEFLKGTPYYDPSGNSIRGHRNGPDDDPMSCFVDFDADTNTIWILGHPELGDLSSYATGAIANGNGCIAQRQYSHAEGIGSIVAGKYGHAEGWYTAAVYAAHSEGQECSAFGQVSHAEGLSTLTKYGEYQHAEGSETSAFGWYSHTEGDRTLTEGRYSHAEGCNTSVLGNHSHCDGYNSVLHDSYAYLWGVGEIRKGNGNKTFTISPEGVDDPTKENSKMDKIFIGNITIKQSINDLIDNKLGPIDDILDEILV